jgi:hypothetical protein
MSHDAWMEIDTDALLPVEMIDIGNYTRNVSPMWRKAMTAAAGNQMSIQDTDGMTGAEALPLLAAALVHMLRNQAEYEEMNPENGWGDYEGATEFMRDCVWACAAHPNAVIRWSV